MNMLQKSRYRVALAAVLGSSLVGAAMGTVIMDYQLIGNPGNPADSTGYGAVDYEYQIGTNQVTIAQYAEFLNAVAKSDPYGLYNSNMGTNADTMGVLRSGTSGSFSYSVIGSGDRPITYVSWFDAARFANWMHNGQGAGDTETGAYTLNGATSGGLDIIRNEGALVWIPTEDEWYKAAYYDPEKDGVGGYWLYPTRSDSLAGNSIGPDHSANYWDDGPALTGPNYLTDVGAYGPGSASAYGTNDQGGNVWEWNDAIIGSSRGLRGGSWYNSGYVLRSSSRSYSGFGPSFEYYTVGFRVASVPEPSVSCLGALLGSAILLRRKRESSSL